ncbi:FkbM family methyltransferase [Pseudoprimorskyibacter insulae]|uniref:Methyltransferase FkbM domain-containing protein n=1 Tax=Pseudoprimorskyibacter insulae TaxID=1695997 RepID=A0A2R8AX88_9RHOB|nr:FkbM family methyltransferase [Pseudoprimorskyibacter insulae]SPF80671.1 hypothetical protein PRI8871_02482 [Pseudoprimorskyibacter insulae]
MARPAPEFDLTAVREALIAGAPVSFDNVKVTAAMIHGARVFFATDKQRDPIQRNHRNGRFYEAAELELLRKYVPVGGTFIDIGANVGNHSLYAAKFLNAACVVPFEPNPLAYRLLMANMVLNGLDQTVRFDHLGWGLSDAPGDGFGVEDRATNLGAARLLAGTGDIPVTTGDLALADLTPDFIKIDVEGMEIGVLEGLRATLQRCQPHMLVEVDQENYDAFDAFMASVNYRAMEVVQRYVSNKNFLIGAVDRVGEGDPVIHQDNRDG